MRQGAAGDEHQVLARDPEVREQDPDSLVPDNDRVLVIACPNLEIDALDKDVVEESQKIVGLLLLPPNDALGETMNKDALLPRDRVSANCTMGKKSGKSCEERRKRPTEGVRDLNWLKPDGPVLLARVCDLKAVVMEYLKNLETLLEAFRKRIISTDLGGEDRVAASARDFERPEA